MTRWSLCAIFSKLCLSKGRIISWRDPWRPRSLEAAETPPDGVPSSGDNCYYPPYSSGTHHKSLWGPERARRVPITPRSTILSCNLITFTEFCLCVGAGTPSCMVFPNSLYSVPNSYFQINLAPTAFLKLQTIHSNHLQKYVNPEGTRTLNLLIRSQTR